VFRHFPTTWGWWKDTTCFPEHVLHFNGAKDIIVFHANWVDQVTAVQISHFRGSSPEIFSRIRHVGIAVDKLRKLCYAKIPPHEDTYGTMDCTCITEECQDYRREEPLPRFLSLFPLIEKFYIASVPSSSTHRPGDQILSSKFPARDANCPCTEGPRHYWPMIRSSDACGQFVIYDDRSSCPFPKFNRVEMLRQHWRPHFPYYRTLESLEIFFIQIWDPETLINSPPCNGCVYKG
jgi:hypothetical protein